MFGKSSFSPDSGPRGGSPNPMRGGGASYPQRAGFGSEQNPSGTPGQEVLTSTMPGNPHSSAGFRAALKKSARSQSRLKDQLPSGQNFSGDGFKKPNYFAQGGARHGIHIGSGAPFTAGAEPTGSDA